MYRQKLQTFILFCLFCVGFYSCASPHLEQDFKEKFQPMNEKFPKLKTMVNFIGLTQDNYKDLNSFTKLFQDTYTDNSIPDSSMYGYAIWKFNNLNFTSTEYSGLFYWFYLPMLVGVPSSKTTCKFEVEFELQDSKREILYNQKYQINAFAYKALLWGYSYDNTLRESFIRALLEANEIIFENLKPSIPKLKSKLINSGSVHY